MCQLLRVGWGEEGFKKKKKKKTYLLTTNVLLFFSSKPWHGGKLSNFDSQFELIKMHTRPIVDIKNPHTIPLNNFHSGDKHSSASVFTVFWSS